MPKIRKNNFFIESNCKFMYNITYKLLAYRD